jgi:hypothetical protein
MFDVNQPSMKPKAKPKNGNGAPGRRAAHSAHAENCRLGLPLILWQNGKVVEKPA